MLSSFQDVLDNVVHRQAYNSEKLLNNSHESVKNSSTVKPQNSAPLYISNLGVMRIFPISLDLAYLNACKMTSL